MITRTFYKQILVSVALKHLRTKTTNKSFAALCPCVEIRKRLTAHTKVIRSFNVLRVSTAWNVILKLHHSQIDKQTNTNKDWQSVWVTMVNIFVTVLAVMKKNQ